MTRSFLLAALLASAATAPAFAADIEIRNFVGKITIVEGTDGVEVTDAGTKGGLDFIDSPEAISIDGGLSEKARNKACGGGMSYNLDWNGKKRSGDTRLKDYPKLRISVPAGSNIQMKHSSAMIDSSVNLNRADLDVSGCFDIRLADVDTINLDKSGSGEFEVGNVGEFKIEKSGSGDIEALSVGTFDLEQSGSGDVEIDRVTQWVKIEKSGSGDVEIDEMIGDFEVQKSGSGDIDIESGSIPSLSIQNSGSGDVTIDAAVVDAFIRASGSGDVYVESISGSLDESTSGSSDFSRGDD